jgi:beta-glucosidase
LGIDKKYRLGYTAKAKKLVEQMTLEEKVSLMSGLVPMSEILYDFDGEKHYNYIPYPAGGLKDKGIPQMLFCDGPRGVVCGTGRSTAFPTPMLRGASFDTELEERIGQAIGREVRAFGGNLFAGICINLLYHPGWGRSQETYGEDTFHLGQMGSAIVKGVLKENVIPCIKHFAFNSMENSRFRVNIDCDKRTEREVFMPHFKECIDNGAAAVMTSYNLYKGTHCGQNKYLIKDLLKGEWDFDGFTMTDFAWGITDTVEAANSGQDIEMCETNYYGSRLVEAVKEGKVPEEYIDEAAIRIIRTLLAFTEADQKTYSMDLVGCDEHISLALESAQKGITLLKNENNVLPINRDKVETIVILGKLANQENLGDLGSGRVYPPYVVTPLQGIAKAAGNKKVIFNDGYDIEHAKTLAQNADYVIFVVGYDHNDEGEYIQYTQVGFMDSVGGDRINSLGLKSEDVRLIKEVGPINPNSAVVLIGGSMIMMEEWKDYVNAILMAYYPGMEGGTALGQILFGDINPSGKLPFVIPKTEADLPKVKWITDYQKYEYYHGYTKLDIENKEPAYPYGFGLSYTKFMVNNVKFKKIDKCIEAKCDVNNIGSREGEEVIQLYVGFSKSKIPRPQKVLKGFKRVALEPGETKTVTIKVPVEQLMWFNEMTNGWELEHMTYDMYLGTSSSLKDLIKGKIYI